MIGQRTRKTYSMGDRIRVLVDRIDPVEKKIQFAILDDAPPLRSGASTGKSSRKSKPKRK
jgi:hypothetical protein